ncbi:MAG: DUF3300 domain-containing protein [Candidatus Eiseniibacteriota bacterium]
MRHPATSRAAFPAVRPRWLRAGLVVLAVLAACGIAIPPSLAEDAPPKLSASQLDNLTAPIALYPDPILAQVMSAATFPDEVMEANTWAQAHKDQHGEALATAMSEAKFPWDPSVQALVPFPTVLETLSRSSTNLQQLGNAVLAQRGDVMDSVQRMRKKAKDAGNLNSNDKLKVETKDGAIEIQPTDPQVIYVPTYDPAVIYEPAPAPSTSSSSSSGGSGTGAALLMGFVAGVAVAEMCDDNWYGGCGFYWGSSTVVIHNGAWGRTWYNRGYYHPPYPPPVYVNRNVNVNVNNINVNNTNINRNNVNNTNVNRNNVGSTGTGDRATAGTTAGTTANRAPATNTAQTSGATRQKTDAGSAARGYSKPASSASTSTGFSGSQNGRKEQSAANRGRASGATSAQTGGGAHRAGGRR